MLHKLRSFNRHRAFTLVELLVVIAIIGVLTVALLPQVRSAQGKARDAARRAVINEITTAIESIGTPPASTGDCLDFSSGPGLAIAGELRAIPAAQKGGGVVLCDGGYFYRSYELNGSVSTVSTGSAAYYLVFVELEASPGNMYGTITVTPGTPATDEALATPTTAVLTGSVTTGTAYEMVRSIVNPSGTALKYYGSVS